MVCRPGKKRREDLHLFRVVGLYSDTHSCLLRHLTALTQRTLAKHTSEMNHDELSHPSGSLLSWSQKLSMLSQSVSLFRGLVALSGKARSTETLYSKFNRVERNGALFPHYGWGKQINAWTFSNEEVMNRAVCIGQILKQISFYITNDVNTAAT